MHQQISVCRATISQKHDCRATTFGTNRVPAYCQLEICFPRRKLSIHGSGLNARRRPTFSPWQERAPDWDAGSILRCRDSIILGLSASEAYRAQVYLKKKIVVPSFWYMTCADKLYGILRDLKPDNVLLDANGHAHLSDFNVATQLSEKKPLRWSKAGSLAYMAPEILAKNGYSTSVDWWSLGITAYELLFGKVKKRRILNEWHRVEYWHARTFISLLQRPFQGATNDNIIEAILNDPLEFPANAEEQASEECLDLIRKVINAFHAPQKSPFTDLMRLTLYT